MEVHAAAGTEAVAGPQGARPPNGWSYNVPNPDTCFNQGGEAVGYGPGPYDCWTAKGFKAGTSSQVTFYLKITNVVPNATGTVELDRDFADSDSANNTASLIINPTTPSGDARSSEEAGPAEADVAPQGPPVDTIAGVPVTRSVALGAALLLVVAVGGGLLYLRTRRAGSSDSDPTA